jgi:hypothetical protein
MEKLHRLLLSIELFVAGAVLTLFASPAHAKSINVDPMLMKINAVELQDRINSSVLYKDEDALFIVLNRAQKSKLSANATKILDDYRAAHSTDAFALAADALAHAYQCGFFGSIRPEPGVLWSSYYIDYCKKAEKISPHLWIPYAVESAATLATFINPQVNPQEKMDQLQISLLKKAEKADPQSAFPHELLADKYYLVSYHAYAKSDAKKYDELSLKEAKTALDLRPNDSASAGTLWVIYQELKNSDEATKAKEFYLSTLPPK